MSTLVSYIFLNSYLVFYGNKIDLSQFLILLFFIIVVVIFIVNRIIKRSRLEGDKRKQNIVALERQRISSELHDEIGSGIYSIKLFTDLASQNKTEVHEIKEIRIMIDDLAQKINEVIWSTNSESDNLESLIYYIEGMIRNMYEHTDITYRVNLPAEIPNMEIDNAVKRNIYLMIKEVCHNALKHSKASLVELKITISNNHLVFVIKDNGVGFDPTEVSLNSMGISNLKLRAKSLNAKLTMETYKGTTVSVNVPL